MPRAHSHLAARLRNNTSPGLSHTGTVVELVGTWDVPGSNPGGYMSITTVDRSDTTATPSANA